MGELAQNVLEAIDGVELYIGGQHNIGQFDFLFSASYPGKIPQEACKLAALGAVNIHTGLLPEGRGSHPLNWALIWGKQRTGITIHKITDTYDAGDIVAQDEIPIFDTDTIRTLRERVEIRFPNVIAAFMQDPKAMIEFAVPQNQALASYAQKRLPEDSELNPRVPARDMWNLYRSCDPDLYPAFITDDKGNRHKVINGQMINGEFYFNLGDPLNA